MYNDDDEVMMVKMMTIMMVIIRDSLTMAAVSSQCNSISKTNFQNVRLGPYWSYRAWAHVCTTMYSCTYAYGFYLSFIWVLNFHQNERYESVLSEAVRADGSVLKKGFNFGFQKFSFCGI